MSIFRPTAVVPCVLDITPELLASIGASAVILDVDNTLSLHGSQVPFQGTVEWSHKIRKAGIAVLILSNNTKERVAPFAAQYGIPFLSRGMKPLPFGYWRCAKLLGQPCERTAVVGDQVFTDIFGANLSGMKSILLTPFEEEASASFRIRRRLEKKIRKKIG